MSQAANSDSGTVDGVRFEQPAEGVARIVLARPEARNAQDKPMLYALNTAFDRAAHDERDHEAAHEPSDGAPYIATPRQRRVGAMVEDQQHKEG